MTTAPKTKFGFVDPKTRFTLDLSGMRLPPAAVARLVQPTADGQPAPIQRAHAEMQQLEAGAIKNPDENRKVTHFSDRLTYVDSELFRDVQAFAEQVRGNALAPAGRPPVEAVIVNGIGGSALGPQLLQWAVNGPYWNELSVQARRGYAKMYFLDNTDASGVADVEAAVDLARALVLTISKSGGTQETLNNMLALGRSYQAKGLNFADHAVAITMPGSKLDKEAREKNWLKIFPMADSIGGRTSETNIVGHVPAALAGIDFAHFVNGARHMDELTRAADIAQNPAYQLAVAWHVAGKGRGDRNMVIVPYSDRLVLLGKYLQQLVMESLGKELDLDGKVVHQGLNVFGNKGGTDAHAYIQQLNDGRDDFFVTFIEILKDTRQIAFAEGLSMGDYLHAFKDGLANALRRKHRQVIEVVTEDLDAFTLGMLIALYERVVAVYAELIHINAFHQPGVQAYKLASKEINDINLKLQHWIATQKGGWSGSAKQAAKAIGAPGSEREVTGMLAKFAVNARRYGGVAITRQFCGGAWRFNLG
ncbi:MAG: hypothetical protein A3K19_25940 [Lentisphaerae bacterium RIFOXYB12_FULL_65_16]|nr:MAG: hypothetical protein A3K18_06800 [Lentisphaerae bacterium RIFOXYA12_64_32]OGV92611.1 MAG: hypothetical protein A3K19_25940 [Lentisphaerae bacterium RIFOXYB12_FULL_65_16]